MMDIGVDAGPQSGRLSAAARPGNRPRRATVTTSRAALALALAGLAALPLLAIGHGEAVPVRQWSGTLAAATEGPVVVSTAEQWAALWRRVGLPAPEFRPGRTTGVAIFLDAPGAAAPPPSASAALRGERLVVTFAEAGKGGPRAAAARPARTPAADGGGAPWTIVLVEHAGSPVSIERRVRD